MSRDRARVVSCLIRVLFDTPLCRVCCYSLCAAPLVREHASYPVRVLVVVVVVVMVVVVVVR
jgi:hypothetical protein